MAEQNWIDLRPDSAAVGSIVAWWEELTGEKRRGERAHLKRCSVPTEVLLEPAYYRLWQQLAPHGKARRNRLAFVVGLLAHVKKNDTEASISAAMATPKKNSATPRVSDLRFRRLLKYDHTTDADMLYAALIRIIRLLDGSVNVAELARAAYWWDERVKQDWAFSYYDKASLK